MPLNHFIPGQTEEIVKRQYQPLFPLVYDDTFGPYKPVTSLEESIQKDFEYLLLTNPGEWPMKPDLGIGIKRYLFENYNSPEIGKIQERVQNQVAKYLPLPYVQIASVEFSSTSQDQDQGFITLNIRYYILSNLARIISVTKDALTVSVLPGGNLLAGYHGAKDYSALKNPASNIRSVS